MAQVITTTAIYQQGTLQLLRLLDLPDGMAVSVSITLPRPQTTFVSDFGALCGIWADKGDLTYAEIEALTHDVIMEHQTALLDEFGVGAS